MIGAAQESLELELELAANALEAPSAAETESGEELWRYLDVWISTGGAWQKQIQIGPARMSFAQAQRKRDDLQRIWTPIANSRGGRLLVRCFQWEPAGGSPAWFDCNSYYRW